ncbi:MAG TPA: hypothetical protein VEV86_16135 [Vicinamibacterales bacterium]|nr:hypothetical protein [Vicinamibacterales bacterium]
MASTFSNETPTGLQRAIHGGDRGIGTLDPVQHRVAEHGVELLIERQVFRIHHMRGQSELSRRFDLCCARIDGNDLTMEIDEFLRERPVSTTQVENALAGTWR